MDDIKVRRIENALWGLFIADALAMPAHWFYSLENLQAQFPGGITNFADAPHPHPESFFVGMEYEPDLAKAAEAGRSYDILHEHVRFYKTTYSEQEIAREEQESEHGNETPTEDDRYHYHHGLKAGENTLGAQLVRVLMRGVIDHGGYDQRRFLTDFISCLTTKGEVKDPYREIYLRHWFENYAAGLPDQACADYQRHTWSIGSHGGMIRPLVLSLLAPGTYQALGLALEHQNLTHRSENVSAANAVAISLLRDLIKGRDLPETVSHYAGYLRLPKVTGERLHQIYREHDGPGNIPDDEMWRLHTEMEDCPFDVEAWVRNLAPEDIIAKRLSSACYPEHGLPLSFYLLRLHEGRFRDSVLADVNAGGDNVHRAMITGMMAGAASEELPEEWKFGLSDHHSLAAEINAFATVAAQM